MRNLRKVVALVLAFAMVLSMSAVSFAAEMTAAEKAETLGVLQGEGAGVTAEYLAKTPTRLQAAIITLRLRGLEDEALAYEGEEMFADQEDITWAGGKNVAAYLKANPELGWIGAGDDMLKPNEPITAQQYVKVMLEALGYEYDVDFAWDEVFTFAASVGLTALSADTAMTNDALAVGSVDALAATNADGEVLIDALVAAGAIDEDKAVAAGLKVEAMDFALVSAEAFGLRAVKFMFTNDVDDDEDVTIEEDSDDFAIDKTVVDGKYVIVTFTATADQTDEVEFTVTATGTDGIEVDEETVDVVLTDKEDPELISVTVENAKTFVVKYSEPIDPSSYEGGTAVFDDVKLDDDKLVGKVEANDEMTELTYTLNEAVAANSYVFNMEAVADFAGFVAPSEAVTVTVVADDAAPQLVEVEVEDTDTIVLVFDEDVEDIGTVTVDGNEYTITDADIDGEEVTVELGSNKLEATDAFVSVEVEWEDVEDVIGNKADGETTFLAPMDDDAPTVKMEVTEDNYVALIFSEDVFVKDVDSAPANLDTVIEVLEANLTVTEADDEDVSITVTAVIEDERTSDDYDNDDDADSKIYLIDFDAAGQTVNEIDYAIEIDTDDIVDGSVLANELAKTEAEVSMFDTKAPSVVGDIAVVDEDGTKQTIRITFDEEMAASTLTDASNYIVNNEPLKQYDYEITVADDNKSVDIEIDLDGEATSDLDGDAVELYGIEDVAENGLATTSYVAADAPDTFADVTFTLTDDNKIEVDSASNSFVVADPDDFELYYYINSSFVTVTSFYVTSAIVDEDDDTVLELTLSDDLKPDATTDNALKLYVGVAKGDTVNTNDVELMVGVSTSFILGDDVAPTAEIELDETDEDLLVVTFDEKVFATDAQVLNDILVYNEDDEEFEALTYVYYDDTDDDGEVDDVVTPSATVGFRKFTATLEADDEYTIELLSRNIIDAVGKKSSGVAEATYEPK